MITYRPLTEEDLEFFNATRNECREFLHDNREFTLEQTKEWFKSLPTNMGYFLVLVDGARAGYVRTRTINKFAIEIGMDISKEFRSKGVAFQAYNLLIADLRDKNYSILTLEVLASNTRAYNIYKKLKFDTLSLYDQPVGDTGRVVPIICMAMNLGYSPSKDYIKSLKNPQYAAYYGLQSRCSNPNDKRNSRYAGRGITVCDEWSLPYGAGLDCFLAWSATKGHCKGLSLDRIDNNGPYSPENCRWTTVKEQNSNRENNHIFTAFGCTGTIVQLHEKFSTLNYYTVRNRVFNYGWSNIEEALTKPIRVGHPPKLYTFNGQDLTLKEIINKFSTVPLTSDQVYKRLGEGWSMERAITTPMRKEVNNG